MFLHLVCSSTSLFLCFCKLLSCPGAASRNCRLASDKKDKTNRPHAKDDHARPLCRQGSCLTTCRPWAMAVYRIPNDQQPKPTAQADIEVCCAHECTGCTQSLKSLKSQGPELRTYLHLQVSWCSSDIPNKAMGSSVQVWLLCW